MKSIALLFVSVALMCIISCSKNDSFITSADAKLAFSLDTLRFDTVFTQQGSATRILKVFNTHSSPIEIEKIKIGNGADSRFRVNIDGVAGGEVSNVKIPANDSIYVFAEVMVNPDQPLSVSPFVIHDELQFLTNGNSQTVVLEAWGQNANYIPNRFNNGGAAEINCGGGEVVWDDPKPYVIFGILVIDNCTLTIPAGAKVYVHGGLGIVVNQDTGLEESYNDGRIIVRKNGTLNIQGTAENPVTIQGDRLEENFSDVSGQWFGIVLSRESLNNTIEYATIKNAVIGVAVDSAAELTARYAQFYNTTSNGIFGIHSTITAENCLIYNNSSTGVRLTYGGNYSFTHCTIASYGVDASALSLSNVLCLDFPACQTVLLNDISASFKNCIIAGSRKDEITLVESPDRLFNYQFENCVVKVEEILEEDQYPNFLDDCENCVPLNNSDALFLSPDESDYHLDTLSIAEEKAMFLAAFPIDLDGEMRDMEKPDIGCYEYLYE